MSATIHCGDVRDVLKTLPANSVQCVVTSPPYYALRDYNVDGQIGLEPTIAEYLAAMVAVFRDVRRVLRDDGTLWLNIGDSYASHDPGGYRAGEFLNPGGRPPVKQGSARNRAGTYRPGGLQAKQLLMIPARLALALQEDGWWVRSEIIWAKPNPMPESVQDRPTVAHEHIWLLTKQARYFYDADAAREDGAGYGRSVPRHDGIGPQDHKLLAANGGFRGGSRASSGEGGRNARTVWYIATQGYAGAHFATFPVEIPRRCILAGTSERGACPACGAPWRRVVDVSYVNPGNRTTNGPRSADNRAVTAGYEQRLERSVATTGWQPTCPCDAGEPVPCVVLDPFSGAGTTGVVALRHGRDYIGVELNAEYAEMSRRRIYGDAPLLNRVKVEAA